MTVFYIVGNGPSLTPGMLETLPQGRWLGMNSAFKFWREIRKYPKYYACLDPVVVKSQIAGIRELMASSPVEKFFLHDSILEIAPKVGQDSRVTLLSSFLARPQFTVPLSGASMHKQTTGAMSVRFAIEEGETDLVLIGIDCNYVNVIEEAKLGEGYELVIDRPVRRNPNYFFDGYQSEGDRYQVPNPAVHGGNLHLQSFICLRNDLAASSGNVRVSVGSVRSLLHKHGVFPFHSYWKSIGRRRLQCVAVPMTRPELDVLLGNLAHWLDPRLRPSLSRRERGTCLHLFFDFHEDSSVVARVDEFLAAHPGLADYFDDVRMTFFGFPREVNYYARYGDPEQPFCAKSGPNLFFLSVMNQCRGYEFTLQMEADCMPLRAGWLDAAEAELHGGAEDAWIIGPAYLGPSPMPMSVRIHINGNAIYQTGSGEFQDFLANEFATILRDLVSMGVNDLAYDAVLGFAYANLDTVSAPCREALMRTLPRLRYSNFILNAGGSIENAADTLDLRTLVRANPDTFLVHGRLAAQTVRQNHALLDNFFDSAPASRELPLTQVWSGNAGFDVLKVTGFNTAAMSGRTASGQYTRAAFHFGRLDTSTLDGKSIAFAARARGDVARVIGIEIFLNQGTSEQVYETNSHVTSDGAVVTLTATTVSPLKAPPKSMVVASVMLRNDDALLSLEFFEISCRELDARGERKTATLVPPLATIQPIIESWRDYLEFGARAGAQSYASAPLGLVLEKFESDEFVLDRVGVVGTAVEIRLRRIVAQPGKRAPEGQVCFKGFPWHAAGGIRVTVKGVGAGESLLARICRHGETPWEYHDITVVDDQPRIVRNFFKVLHSGFCFEIHKSHGLRAGQELTVRLERIAPSGLSQNRFPISLSERITVSMDTSALEEGWYPLETFDGGTYRWTGPEKRVTLDLPIKRDRELLGVVAYHMVVAKKQLRALRVEVDGVAVPHVVRSDLKPRCIVFRIPARTSVIAIDTELALVVPPVTPRNQSSRSTDERPLGIAVMSVSAIPAEPALSVQVPGTRAQSLRRRIFGPSKRERIADAFPHSHFDGLAYLQANPDAAEAVLAGSVASALEHYRKRSSNDKRSFALAVSRAPNIGALADLASGR